MKIAAVGSAALAVLVGLGIAGCSTGKPGFRQETMRPDQQHSFKVLYAQNCSACHGAQGRGGAALPMDNPVYLAWAGSDRIRQIVSDGVPQHLMPPFGPGGGGLLTSQQVDDIVNGMITHWGKPGILNGATAPGYRPTSNGDAKRGQAVFQTYCARCHGSDGKGLSPGMYRSSRTVAAAKPNSAVGSIVDPTFLSLISRQGLRDIVVTGMPGENMPDWRGDVPGKTMTDEQVTDVVAWLVSHRVQFPGQPFPGAPH